MSRELTGNTVTQVREGLLDILRDLGCDNRQATDGINILFNCLLRAVMIETHRGRGGSPTSFGLGLRHLITDLRSAIP